MDIHKLVSFKSSFLRSFHVVANGWVVFHCVYVPHLMLNEICQTEKVKNHVILLMWDIKLKAAHEQTKQTIKQKLIGTDNSILVIRGKEAVE